MKKRVRDSPFGVKMRRGLRAFVIAAAAAAMLVWFMPASFAAQSAGTRPTPRTRDGKPDLQGIWQTLNTAEWDLEAHEGRPLVPPGMGVVEGETIPYQPWALAKKKENFARRETADPVAKCYMPGVPRATYMPFPFQIIQTSGHIAILYEYAHVTRHVYTDGSAHPKGPIEWFIGDSRGRWEEDTLVVDVVHFTDQTWFDKAGNFHSEALHVIERYTLTDPETIMYEATIEDPKVFTRPWKISMPLYRRKEKNIQLLEYECYSFPEGAFEPPTR